ncbi:MAG: hypothetical protein PHW84_10255 [Methanosarcina sp.]|nr:hypothetical protein [Methanosarcina sp.]
MISDIDIYLLMRLIGFILLIIFLIFIFGNIHFYLLKLKKVDLSKAPKASKKYRGLVVSISMARKNKETLILEIDSLYERVKKDEAPEKLLHNFFKDTVGIGQTFSAIYYHRENLEVCWLLYTERSNEAKEVVKYFIAKFVPTVTSVEILIEDASDFKGIQNTISRIYPTEFEKYDMEEKDIISDITGGTTPMSGAIIIECNNKENRVMQYTKQNEDPELIEIKRS